MLSEEKLVLGFKDKEILENLYLHTVLENVTSLHQGEKLLLKFVITLSTFNFEEGSFSLI